VAKVVPRQVVQLIDRLFPWAASTQASRLTLDDSAATSALVELVGHVPPELLPTDQTDYTDFVCSVAALRSAVAGWESGRSKTLDSVPGFRGHPVMLIHRALNGLPDEAPAADTPTLLFLLDAEFAENLRRDISAATSALSNGEWKAVTVLAGSVIEALLLWELQKHPPADISTLASKGPLEMWHLPDYIATANQLGCVRPGTVTDAKQSQLYRNLIHPGRALRLGEQCDRGTAYIALGALDHVTRDLDEHVCLRHRKAVS
jgi:hypothetical protein